MGEIDSKPVIPPPGAEYPLVMWTTEPPAKSLTPHTWRNPFGDHTRGQAGVGEGECGVNKIHLPNNLILFEGGSEGGQSGSDRGGQHPRGWRGTPRPNITEPLYFGSCKGGAAVI